MAVEFFKYNLYRKYETSDGVTYTPLDEYQCVLVDNIPNNDCANINFNAYTNGYIGRGVGSTNILKLTENIEKFDDFYSVDSEKYLDIEGKNGIYTYSGKSDNVEDFYFTFKDGLTSLYKLFYGCDLNEVTIIKKFDTSKLTDISYMFYDSSSIHKVNLNNLDVSNVQNFSHIFDESGISTVECGDWTMPNANDVSYMFYNCRNIKYINASNWDLNNVENKKYMFYNRTNIDLNHIKCKKNFRKWCWDNKTEIDLPTAMQEGRNGLWEIIDETSYIDMTLSVDDNNKQTQYIYDKNLIEYTTLLPSNELFISKIDDNTNIYEFENGGLYNIRYFTRYNLNDLTRLFYNCESFIRADLSNFDGTNITSLDSIFSNCSNLTEINLSNFVTSNVTNMSNMFYGCSGLTNLDVSNFDTAKVTDMSNMFDSCMNLTSLDLSKFNTSNVTNMTFMFYRCSGLTSLDLRNFYTPKLTDMNGMFNYCSGLTSIDLRNFDTSKVTDMTTLFNECIKLSILDLSSFNTNSLTKMNYMFGNCTNLTSIDLSNFDTTNVKSMINMFQNCNKLIHIKCKQPFKIWCITNKDTIQLPQAMREGGSGTWEIVE